MLSLNKPDSRKVREMSFSHSQLLNTDQPPKKVVFTQIIRIIALVAMISGLLSFALPFIFDFVSRLMGPIEFLVILSGPVAALVGVALGLLSLLLGAYDPKTCRLAVIGILTGVVWFIVVLVWILFGGLRGILPGPC
jgi:hypothetical protein